MTGGRGVGVWGAGVLLLPISCAGTSPPTQSSPEATSSDGEKPESAASPSAETPGASAVVAESPASSNPGSRISIVASVLGRRWFHWVCVRPPAEPPAKPATPEEPKKTTGLGAKLDALGNPPEAPRPPAPTVNPWYAPQCNYLGVPINIDYQDGPDPLEVACNNQRKACDARLNEAALRRVPKRAEVVIDRRGEAESVTIYQNEKLLDDDELEDAVLCFFAMLPGEVAWKLERCSGS